MDMYGLAGPLLRRIDPELAHRLALRALAAGLVAGARAPPESALRQEIFGLSFPSPLGLAAGFDKDGVAIARALGLGFGFVEVGTVTPRPQPGNPKPRLFRLAEDRAVINRLGFNNRGQAALAAQLEARDRGLGVVGVNLGRNTESADQIGDYLSGLEVLGPLADYLVVNVSSPNTPGLRGLQAREPLGRLLGALSAARAALSPAPPLLLKVSPDLDQAEREAIANVVLDQGLDGLIVANTTTGHRPGLRSRQRHQPGGLSGAPLMAPSTACLADFYRLCGGRLPLVGVGGVASAADAYAKICAGASLVQLYTALVYEGPGLVARINRELPALLAADGFGSIGEAVGSAAQPAAK